MNTIVTTHSFHGGIHPQENKAQSTVTALQSLPLPEHFVLSLRQHSGQPAKPCVNIGDHVLKGQCIATAQGARSAPIHAPSSGIVIAIEPRPIAHSSGLSDTCIVIQSDGQDQWVDKHPLLLPEQRLHDLDRTTLLNHIRQAGIVGLGGAGFPTAAKLDSAHPIHTVILNAAECEPYITADDMLMREQALHVVQGAQLLQHVVAADRLLLGIEDNKPDAIEALEHAKKQLGVSDLHIVVIPTLYPSGSEKHLIKLLTGEEVPSGGIPADLGVLCQNVGTAAAIAQAVYLGEPLITRVTTFTGAAIQRPGNYEVLIGTPLTHALTCVGYQAQTPERVIAGGPLMGFTLPSLNIAINKTSNCFLAPTLAELPLNEFAMECIRCGQCATVCPQELLPQQLYWFSKAQDHDQAQQHNIFDCIECGACSYVCPSRIPLVHYYRHTKGAIRLEQAAHIKAEQAKVRFEQRNARIERLAQEREAMRQARAAAKANAEAAALQTSNDNTAECSNAQTLLIEELERKILAQKDRLKKSEERWQAAQAAHLETATLLENAFSKQQEKLFKLEQDLLAAQSPIKEA